MLSILVAVLTLAAMAGVLYPAAWVLYALCLAGGVGCWSPAASTPARRLFFFTPGSVLFWGAALALAVYFLCASRWRRILTS